MSGAPDNDDTLNVFRDKMPAPTRTRSRWRPQMTLGSLILLVMLVALGTAYLVNNRTKTQELERLKQHYEAAASKQKRIEQTKENARIYVTKSPGPNDYDFARVISENAFGTNRNDYSILVFLDPEKSYLLHYTTQNIPFSGTPMPQTTYHIAAVGKRENSCFFLRFLVSFDGTGHQYDDDTQPYEGNIELNTYFSSFGNIGEADEHSDGPYLRPPVLTEKLQFQKPKQIGDERIEDWTHWLLREGLRYDTIQLGSATQLIRIRSEPLEAAPRPGLMLWIEELGSAPIPPGALPFKSKL